MNTALLLALLVPAADTVPAPDVRDNVSRGLKWLADQQKTDGSWDAPNGLSRSLITARAGSALLMEGSTTSTGNYAPNLRKAAAWFAAQTPASGRLGGNNPTETQVSTLSQAHALVFLVSVHDAETDAVRAKEQAALLTKAVEFALAARTSVGGWSQGVPRDFGDSTDTQSTAEMLSALLIARKAGVAVPRNVVERAMRILETVTTSDGGLGFYNGPAAVRPAGGGNAYASASGAALALTSGDVRPAPLPGWVRHARRGLGNYERTLPQQGYFSLQQTLAFARVAYALGEGGHNRLDEADDSVQVVWSRERAKLFKAVVGLQKADGSWPDQFGAPAYATALALTTLQLDNGYLPAFTR